MSFWDERERKEIFQKLPFHNVLFEKPKIKYLKNIDLLHELPFYDELSVVEISKAFKGYARSYLRLPNVRDLQGTFRVLSGDQQKIDDLMKKLFFRCNSPCFTHLFLFSTGKTNIQKV